MLNLGIRVIRFCLIASMLCLFCACQTSKPTNQPFSHEVYIWQHRWTPALKAAITTATPLISAWHVLGAELSQKGRFNPVRIDTEALKQSGKPVILVIRINGQLSNWTNETITTTVLSMANAWREAGLDVTGIEIDYDCATRQLASYTQALILLKQALVKQQLQLHITVLPTWLPSAALPTLLAQTDQAVLQVHSVSNPRKGLFDAKLAATWLTQFSELSPVKFRVALPTYGSRVSWNEQENIIGVESEISLGLLEADTQELNVKPEAVAALLHNLQQKPPSNFLGTVWFRLPTADDQRAWSLSTWQAVVTGQPLYSKFAASSTSSDNSGAYNILLSNEGDIDANAPNEIHVSTHQSCHQADAINFYRLAHSANQISFQLDHAFTLRAHQQLVIGWVRCPTAKPQVSITP